MFSRGRREELGQGADDPDLLLEARW